MGAVLTERSEQMKHTNIRRKVITTVILLAVGILFLPQAGLGGLLHELYLDPLQICLEDL